MESSLILESQDHGQPKLELDAQSHDRLLKLIDQSLSNARIVDSTNQDGPWATQLIRLADYLVECVTFDLLDELALSRDAIRASFDDNDVIIDRLVKFCLTVETLPATPPSQGRLSFQQGEFRGEPLFGRQKLSAPSHLVRDQRNVGGTIVIVAPPKYFARLARISELVCFATLSLMLETAFLHDTACSRPPPPPPMLPVHDTPPDSPTDTSSSKTKLESDQTRKVAFERSQTLDVVDGANRQSAKWSKSGLWSIIVGGSSSDRSKLKKRLKDFVASGKRSKHDHDTAARSRREGSAGSGSLSIQRGPSLDLGSREHTWGFVGSLDRLPASKLSSIPAGKSVGVESNVTSATLPPSSTAVASKRFKEEEEMDRFQNVMRKMQEAVLSISPDVEIPPPFLLVKLRRDEIEATESAALTVADGTFTTKTTLSRAIGPPARANSLELSRSQTSRPDRTAPMRRMRAYSTVDTRAVALGVVAEHRQGQITSKKQGSSKSLAIGPPKLGLEARAGLASLLTHNNSLEGVIRHQGIQFLAEMSIRTDLSVKTGEKKDEGSTMTVTATKEPLCRAPPRWLSFHYYDDHKPQHVDERQSGEKGPGSNEVPDLTVGQFIRQLVKTRETPCETCKGPMSDHRLTWSHSAERIIVVTDLSVSSEPSAPIDGDKHKDKEGILAWTTCKICRAETDHLTLSTASSLFSFAKYAELLLYDANLVPEPQLCEHAPTSRGALVRCFQLGSVIVSIELEPITLFELQMPKSAEPATQTNGHAKREEKTRNRVNELSLEVEAFYRSLIEFIEALISRRATGEDDQEGTDKVSSGGLKRSDSEKTVKDRLVDKVKHAKDALVAKVSDIGSDEDEGGELDVQILAAQLITFFKEDRDDMLHMVDATLDDSCLNDGRWTFLGRIEAAVDRVQKWQRKHGLTDESYSDLPKLVRPFYADHEMHALPVGTSVVLREKEISSAIAMALSSPAYRRELELHTQGKAAVAVDVRKVSTGSIRLPPSLRGNVKSTSRQPIPFDLFASIQPAADSVSSAPTASSSRSSIASSTKCKRDPDDLTANFLPDDEIEYLATPRKPSKALGSTLLGSVRGIGKQMSVDSMRPSPVSSPSEETLSSLNSPSSSSLSDRPKAPLTDSVLEKLVSGSSAIAKPPPSPLSMSTPSIISSLSKARTASSPARPLSSSTSALHDRKPSTSPAFSGVTVEVAAAVGRGETYGVSDGTTTLSALRSQLDVPATERGRDSNVAKPADQSSISGLRTLLGLPVGMRRTSSSTSENRKDDGAAAAATSTPLTRDVPAANLTGHIKFKTRHGDKLFRVTVYHAQKFQTLRMRCGIEEHSFVESLSRCDELTPSGGKSTARFWQTRDKKYVLKELKETWPVSERDAFMQFAPHLIDYLLNVDKGPSLLTKILGFYTVKHKNVKTKEVKKVSLVVMENQFASKDITRQYDLKGIATRVAKRKSSSGPSAERQETGWDSDWLSGSLDSRLLIYAHSKVLLREALENDCNFLAESGCIDYSLLVGVDDKNKLIHVGVIDTLGTFNALKRLENLSKTGLKFATLGDKDEVTVVPPKEYADRFRQAMTSYFVAVPEKLTRPIGEDKDLADPRLASVL